MAKTTPSDWPRVRPVVIHGRERWMVDYQLAVGKRRRRYFEKEEDARQCAELARKLRERQGAAGFTLTEAQRTEAADCIERLAKVGATLSMATDDYISRRAPSGSKATVSELVAKFLASKKASGRKANYIAVATYTFGKFEADFGSTEAASITPEQIEAWINGQNWADRTRKNYFCDLRNLFGFGVKRQLVGHNPLLLLDEPLVTEKSPGVLTVEQAKALLENASDMLAPVALGLFAGIRTEELSLLQWSNIDLVERNIHVPPEIAKTREGRDIAIGDTLLAWLNLCTERNGYVGPSKSFDYHLGKARTRAGITDWPQNAMRHSFASYHLKHYNNAPLTASMLGHQGSTSTLFRRYQKRVTPSSAAAYWSLLPSAS